MYFKINYYWVCMYFFFDKVNDIYIYMYVKEEFSNKKLFLVLTIQDFN